MAVSILATVQMNECKSAAYIKEKEKEFAFLLY
jgi:hypothetical protein